MPVAPHNAPRTYRLTYVVRRPTPMEEMGHMLKDVHEDPVLAAAATKPQIQIDTKMIDCATYRADMHFVHFSIFKRFDEERSVPVWLNVYSIPWERVVEIECVRDDSDHMQPMPEVMHDDALYERTSGVALQ